MGGFLLLPNGLKCGIVYLVLSLGQTTIHGSTSALGATLTVA